MDAALPNDTEITDALTTASTRSASPTKSHQLAPNTLDATSSRGYKKLIYEKDPSYKKDDAKATPMPNQQQSLLKPNNSEKKKNGLFMEGAQENCDAGKKLSSTPHSSSNSTNLPSQNAVNKNESKIGK